MQSKLKFLVRNNLAPKATWAKWQLQVLDFFIDNAGQEPVFAEANFSVNKIIAHLACAYALTVQNCKIGILSTNCLSSYENFKYVKGLLARAGHAEKDLLIKTPCHDEMIANGEFEPMSNAVDAITTKFTDSTIEFFEHNRFPENCLDYDYLFFEEAYTMDIKTFYLNVIPILQLARTKMFFLGTRPLQAAWERLINLKLENEEDRFFKVLRARI